jgi:hypothetical protein
VGVAISDVSVQLLLGSDYIMGGKATKTKEEEKTTTEVLTMHPSWKSHGNEETNSGIVFSLLNIHISYALGTLVFCLCTMIFILLSYLGYRRFCHRPKRKDRESTALTVPPPTCATCSSCTAPPTASLRPWDREAMTMEDKYYASLRQRDDFDDLALLPISVMNSRNVMNSISHVMTNNNVIMLDGLWIQWRSFDFFCRQFLWQMWQFPRRLFIRLLLQWHKFIKFLHRLPICRSSISALLPTTLTLLLHDALFSSKEHSLKLLSILFYVHYKNSCRKEQFQSRNIPIKSMATAVRVTQILE